MRRILPIHLIGGAAAVALTACASMPRPAIHGDGVVYSSVPVGPTVAVLHNYNELGDSSNTIRIISIDRQELPNASIRKLLPVTVRPGKHSVGIEYIRGTALASAQVEFVAVAGKDYILRTDDGSRYAYGLPAGQRNIEFWVSDAHSDEHVGPSTQVVVNG